MRIGDHFHHREATLLPNKLVPNFAFLRFFLPGEFALPADVSTSEASMST